MEPTSRDEITPPLTVPFAFLVSLFRALAEVKPRRASKHAGSALHDTRVRDVFARWVAELRRRFLPLPPGTTAIVFRWLFPEQDLRRKYEMQEKRLVSQLADALALSREAITRLMGWHEDARVGCLGSELKQILEERNQTTISQNQGEARHLSEMDSLLDELSMGSDFTCSSLRNTHARQNRRSVRQILVDLLEGTTPFEAAIIVQVILKDLRPLIYPITSTGARRSLLDFKSNAIKPLELTEAVWAWDPSGTFKRAYAVRATLDAAADEFEIGHARTEPIVGVSIKIPKSVKGQSCEHSLHQFPKASCVWAEVKYDGERTQIHVVVAPDGSSNITIFSKSGRDSTMDRVAVLNIVKSSLGLPTIGPEVTGIQRPMIRNIVLEAEMVAYSTTRGKIDEFWTISRLIGQTSQSARAQVIRRNSVRRPESDGEERHLALVFFDVLVLNSSPLLMQPYSARRNLLESVITPLQGKAMIAERHAIQKSCIPGSDSSQDPAARLRDVFASVLARHEEGLMLKADDGHYGAPWVKLKRDYIRGFGDAIDVCLLGAGWNKDRGRELRVGPDTFTTFYMGASSSHQTDSRPHFEGYFVAEYGLGREALEELNFLITTASPIVISSSVCRGTAISTDVGTVSFSGLPPGMQMPSVVLRTPLCAEVYGDRFTKDPPYLHYAPRFSRITKVYRLSERSWATAVLLKDLDTTARTAVGLERANKEVDDDVKRMWGLTASPSLSSTPARRRRERVFVEQLQDAERVPLQKRTRTPEFERVDHEQKFPSVLQKRRREPSASSASIWPKRPVPVLESMNTTFRDGPTRTVPRDLDCQALGLPSTSSSFTSGGADITLLSGEHRTSLCDTPVSLLPPVPPVLSLAPSSDSPLDGNLSITGRKTFRIADLLQKAVVWLARLSSRPRPTSRPSIRNLAPQALVIHDWNAFLVACGWDDGRPIPNSHIGVVFVNVQEEGGKVEWIKRGLRLVMARDSAGHLGCAHPIVVLDERLLQYGELDREHDLEAEAIFQVGSGL